MANTLRPSLLSILSQITDDYEVVVVDGGSTDGSMGILNELSEEFEHLRVVELPDSEKRSLGMDRNIGIEKSNGDYVLTQLDADDIYSEGIQDFVRIFHALDDVIDHDFYLKGDSINMAKREFLLKYPYRDFNRYEDGDLWKRLFADDAIIWLDHESFWSSIGYDESIGDEIKNNFYGKMGALRAGVSLQSCIKDTWKRRKVTDLWLYFDLVTFAIANVAAWKAGKYHPPNGYQEYGELRKTIEQKSSKFPELAERFDININEINLSENGTEIFVNY